MTEVCCFAFLGATAAAVFSRRRRASSGTEPEEYDFISAGVAASDRQWAHMGDVAPLPTLQGKGGRKGKGGGKGAKG
eukprot:CAMPEP_0204396730 /NCGR_PEP_ID=MMETSP0470-20130426/1622_1 /ASSEMBLY_ACC=CAM_ASM_000385 /TAXON_ID=2969 /ORGANISM="Oxyrrhis marina" /LENGTH=76 /DNA_ID=CAMNT_0051391037 /DNA_START=39 /DNA_END=266 /DNA_ORIENTATION=+